MPAADIALTREELLAFLDSHATCLLAWNSGAPSPEVVVASYVREGDDLVVEAGHPDLFESLQRRPDVVCVVEQSPTYYEIKHAVIRGRAQQITCLGWTRLSVPLLDVTTASFAKIRRDP